MILSGILAVFYMLAIGAGSYWWTFISGIFLWGMIYQATDAGFATFYAEQFPIDVRVSGLSMGLNLGIMISSSMIPVFALLASHGAVHVPLKIGIISLIFCWIAASAVFFSKETFRTVTRNLG